MRQFRDHKFNGLRKLSTHIMVLFSETSIEDLIYNYLILHGLIILLEIDLFLLKKQGFIY